MLDLAEIRRQRVMDEEIVARAIFSPSFFTRDGNIGPQAFFFAPVKGKKEKDISVLRECLCDDIAEAVKSIPPRNDQDKVSGYAELNVGAIRRVSFSGKMDDVIVDVKVSPSVRIPSHASIIVKNNNRRYSSDDNSSIPVPPALLRVMANLAAISNYVSFAIGKERNMA